MTVIFTAAAFEEGYEAAAWYDLQRPGLGSEFMAALSAALESIEAAPQSYPLIELEATGHELRQCIVKRFPYVIIFEILADDQLVALAMAHTSRRPDYWQDRLS